MVSGQLRMVCGGGISRPFTVPRPCAPAAVVSNEVTSSDSSFSLFMTSSWLSWDCRRGKYQGMHPGSRAVHAHGEHAVLGAASVLGAPVGAVEVRVGRLTGAEGRRSRHEGTAVH